MYVPRTGNIFTSVLRTLKKCPVLPFGKLMASFPEPMGNQKCTVCFHNFQGYKYAILDGPLRVRRLQQFLSYPVVLKVHGDNCRSKGASGVHTGSCVWNLEQSRA
jgi:hypothetical protein